MNNRMTLFPTFIAFAAFAAFAFLAATATASPIGAIRPLSALPAFPTFPTFPEIFHAKSGYHAFGYHPFRHWDETHSLSAAELLAKVHARYPIHRDADLGFLFGGHGGPGASDPCGFHPPATEATDHGVPPQPPAVPEPATSTLFALGVLGILGLRGVRKSRAG